MSEDDLSRKIEDNHLRLWGELEDAVKNFMFAAVGGKIDRCPGIDMVLEAVSDAIVRAMNEAEDEVSASNWVKDLYLVERCKRFLSKLIKSEGGE